MTDKEILEEIEYNVLNDPFTTFNQDSSYESVQIKATAIEELVKRFKKQQKEIEDLKKEKRILIEKYTEVVYECGKRNKEIAELRNIIFKFIPKSNHEVELRTKIINLLGE